MKEENQYTTAVRGDTSSNMNADPFLLLLLSVRIVSQPHVLSVSPRSLGLRYFSTHELAERVEVQRCGKQQLKVVNCRRVLLIPQAL